MRGMNCAKTLSEKLQKLQNRAARILTSSSYDADAGYRVTTTWLERPDCPASNSSSFHGA